MELQNMILLLLRDLCQLWQWRFCMWVLPQLLR